MGKFVRIRIIREVKDPTVMGIQREKLITLPLDNEPHEISMMEFKAVVQILEVSDDLRHAFVLIGGEKHEIGGRYIDDYIKDIPPRFRFWVDFTFLEEDYGDEELPGYKLAIHEAIAEIDTYSRHEGEADYELEAKVGEGVYLEKIRAHLQVIDIDTTNGKVMVGIADEKVEATLDMPGQYGHSEQCGYNDSFEASSKTVDVTIVTK